ncbi:MAG: class I SAM-dependent methyltransferase [Anaerolineales bacterium]|nr:class I SAM-dependent methyltransferase [Anaerolineales bacterium]
MAHPPHTHTHRPAQNGLLNHLYAGLHNTQLWADYMPRLPRGFYGLALAGVASWLGAFALRQNIWLAGALIVLGLGLLAPVAWAVLFIQRRQRLRLSYRQHVLDSIQWRGDERVLDVGCGSGILLNGAAQRLTTGTALGIDIWAANSGGGDYALLMKNARAENVANRIEFQTMDARRMTLADAAFDVVLSSGALHHMVRSQSDFEQVVAELTRVLKPGGQIAIWDIEHLVDASAKRLGQLGIPCEVTRGEQFLNNQMSFLVGRKVM